jgi:hypothetical protein
MSERQDAILGQREETVLPMAAAPTGQRVGPAWRRNHRPRAASPVNRSLLVGLITCKHCGKRFGQLEARQLLQAWLDHIEIDPYQKRGVLYLPTDAYACFLRDCSTKGNFWERVAEGRVRVPRANRTPRLFHVEHHQFSLPSGGRGCPGERGSAIAGGLFHVEHLAGIPGPGTARLACSTWNIVARPNTHHSANWLIRFAAAHPCDIQRESTTRNPAIRTTPAP